MHSSCDVDSLLKPVSQLQDIAKNNIPTMNYNIKFRANWFGIFIRSYNIISVTSIMHYSMTYMFGKHVGTKLGAFSTSVAVKNGKI